MAYGFSYGPQGQIASASEAQGRNTNSIMAGWVDRGPWQYWDTLQAIAGAPLASSYSQFAVPQGALNPLVAGNVVKTKLQTNMQQPGTFPPPKCLLLLAIGFFFGAQPVGANPAVWTGMFLNDIQAILNASYMEFRIDDKIFHEGQLWEFSSGAGISGATSQSGQQQWNNGLPSPVYQRRYADWSKYIAPLQLFSMNIILPGTPPTMDANGPGLYITSTLDGLTDRSVQ
jgi:hypothetical protein